MNPKDRAELEAVLEYARRVRDDPRTDPLYSRVLDRWIRRDEGHISDMAAVCLLSLTKDSDEEALADGSK